MLPVRVSDRRTVALLDGLALFWVVFWLFVSAATASEIWALSEVSSTAEISAEAVDQAGQALQQISELPLVGDEPGQLGTKVRQAAGEIADSADRTRTAAHRLSVLLGVTIFLVPTAPVWALYLPSRRRRRVEVSALAARVRTAGPDNPALLAYLASRAVTNLPFEQLSRISDDPVGDVVRGRHEALAQAELRRLGVRREAG